MADACKWCGSKKYDPQYPLCPDCHHSNGKLGFIAASGWGTALTLIIGLFAAGLSTYQATETANERQAADLSLRKIETLSSEIIHMRFKTHFLTFEEAINTREAICSINEGNPSADNTLDCGLRRAGILQHFVSMAEFLASSANDMVIGDNDFVELCNYSGPSVSNYLPEPDSAKARIPIVSDTLEAQARLQKLCEKHKIPWNSFFN